MVDCKKNYDSLENYLFKNHFSYKLIVQVYFNKIKKLCHIFCKTNINCNYVCVFLRTSLRRSLNLFLVKNLTGWPVQESYKLTFFPIVKQNKFFLFEFEWKLEL